MWTAYATNANSGNVLLSAEGENPTIALKRVVSELREEAETMGGLLNLRSLRFIVEESV
jgi:hypothetical protein